MPYSKNPITYPTGKVSEDTAQINTNFSILADAFYNSDPENSPIYRACYVGIIAPLNPKVGQIWVDTSVAPPVIKVYNGTNQLEVKPASVDQPSTPYVGQFWFDTTISPPVLKIYDGTNWRVVNAPYEGNTAPTSPYIGQLWLDTSVNPPILKIYDGTNWQSNVNYANNANNANNANYANNADKLDGQDGSYYLNRANHTGTQPPSSISPQGSGSGLNADMLDTFHASLTPGPNVIVPLDASGILDLSATYVKSNVYSFRRVNLTGATSDYLLQVGEEAYINFSNATSVPLHIATSSNAFYWLYCTCACKLLPNNTTYSNAFRYTDWGINYDGTNVLGANTGGSDSSFNLGNTNGTSSIIAYIDITNAKTITQHIAVFGSYPYSIRHIACHWISPASWTSLGTLSFAASTSGYVLVRRLA